MLSISGYGGTGPRSSYAAYASNICNHVGLTSAWGHTHGYHFDYVAAFQGTLGVMAALRQRPSPAAACTSTSPRSKPAPA